MKGYLGKLGNDPPRTYLGDETTLEYPYFKDRECMNRATRQDNELLTRKSPSGESDILPIWSAHERYGQIKP